jgi:DHA1 family tetracycline resistance protein-like MFS transporter
VDENINANVEGEDKLEFRVALPLFLIVLIDAFSVTVILPLLPYYATAFGLDIYALGILLATSPVLEQISSPLYKGVSKKLGRRPVLIVSQLGTFAGFLLLGAASTVWMLFLARVVDGIASGNNTIGRRLVRDSLTPSTRTHGMGLVEAAYSLGFLAGPLVGFITLALTNDDYRMIPYVAAGISLFAVIMSVFLARETLPPERRKSSGLSTLDRYKAKFAPLRRPVVLFTLAMFFLVQFSYIGFIQFYGLLTLNRLGMNALSTAAFWLLGGVVVIIIDGLIVGKLSQRFSERWLVLVGLGLLSAGLISVATTPQIPVTWYSRAEIIEELSLEESILGFPTVQELQIDLPPEGAAGWLGFGWFLLALFLIMIGGSMLIPAIKSLLIGDRSYYGVSGVLTVSSILYKTAFIIVPLVLGFAIWKFGFTAPFLVEGLVLVIFFVLAFILLEPGSIENQ